MSEVDPAAKDLQAIESGSSGPAAVSGPGMSSGPSFTHQVALMTGSVPDPLVAKLKDQHIDRMIEADREEAAQGHRLELTRMWMCFGSIVLGLAFIVAFTWLFIGANAAIVEKVLIGAISFVGGLGTGLGAPRLLGGRKPD